MKKWWKRLVNLGTFLVAVSREDNRWIFAISKSFGVLNGDRNRARIVEAVAARTTCQVAIETGTFLGETARWLAKLYKRVVTLESHPGFATFARLRIENCGNVDLEMGDSATKFGQILASVDGAFFAYLDAHWGSELPLGAELAVLDKRSAYVCMIDDFQIPGTEFRYDVYNGISIGPDLIRRFAPSIKRIFVPDYAPEEAGPQRRGYCVFAAGEPLQLLETDRAKLRLKALDL